MPAHVAGIHVFLDFFASKTWMAETKGRSCPSSIGLCPAMTEVEERLNQRRSRSD
jgi:hypothetical protein